MYTSREVYKGSSLPADFNFKSVSGLYKNFTRMSPSEFYILINLIGEKNIEKGQCSGKPFLCKKGWHRRCVSVNSVTLPSVHSILQLQKRSRNRTALQIRTTVRDRSIGNEKNGSGADGGDVSRCKSRPAQALAVSSL